MRSNNKLPLKHYLGPDVVHLAPQFLGRFLHTNFNGIETIGKIVEVEAYSGAIDRASHAYKNKVTPRTATMFETGGIAYIYLIYGMYHLFNIVTNQSGHADAILVRGIEPIQGIDIMQSRRKMHKSGPLLTRGPGRLSQALGITTGNNGVPLTADQIWISNGEPVKDSEIHVTTRIGVDYAGKDAMLPWRFYIKNNIYVSK